MKRVIISISFILLIVGAGCLSLMHLKQATAEMNEALDQLTEAVKAQDAELVLELATAFEETWDSHEKILLRYIHHDVLDPITGSVSRLSALGEYKKYPEIASEIEHIRKLINHIYEEEFPTIRNIF